MTPFDPATRNALPDAVPGERAAMNYSRSRISSQFSAHKQETGHPAAPRVPRAWRTPERFAPQSPPSDGLIGKDSGRARKSLTLNPESKPQER